MKHKHSMLRRALSIVLSFAIVLPTTLSLVADVGSARALTSLQNIETLKASNTTFNILEIVPTAGQGSIGYYIAGQEPCANWIYDVATKSGQAARKSYMNDSTNGLLTKLTNANILGTGDTTPLKSAGAYNEVYPWSPHDGFTKLTLDTAEQTTATGTFTPATNGEYTQSKGFSGIVSNGAYVQVIKNFSAANAEPGQYYYIPTFKVVGSTDIGNNVAVYTNTATINNPTANPVDDGYVYHGTTGTGFQGMEIGTTYYYVTGCSGPSVTKLTNEYYVGVSDAYRVKNSGETGYFDIDPSKLIYTYVGSGGTYNFTYGAGASNNIICNTVYYTGGYTNNNWFLKYVLDYTPGTDAVPSIKFKVNSVMGSSATVADVNNAKLVVLSNGFVPSGTATAYSSTNDISSEVSSAIIAAVQKSDTSDQNYDLPVIVDNRLTSSNAARLKSLAATLKNGNAKSTFASASVFFFAPDTTRTALATNQFYTMYNTSDYAVSGSAFYPAYDVIVYENFIRKQENSTLAPLEEKVNMARTMRYAINYANQRVKGLKGSISVLYLEPVAPSAAQIQTLKSSVSGWSGYVESKITIASMSTLEFVGKNDDLIENYDIVYVGDNNLTAVPKLDNNFLYANIGAQVDIPADAVGLTDSEYMSGTGSTFSYSGKTYSKLKTAANMPKTRYSGNDLSTKKLNDLNSFALAGHPVIIAGGLTTGTVSPGTGEVTFEATITGSQSGTSAVLTASATATSGELPASVPTYQWYKNGSLDSSATSNTYTATTAGTYYCTVTYTVNGTAHTATSNTLSLTPKTGYKYTEINNGSSGTSQTSTVYTLTLSRVSNRYTVTVSPTKDNIYYQWQGRSGGSWHDINGVTTANTLTDSNYSRYRCEVIIDGTTETTNPLYSYDTSTSKDVTITTSVTYNAIVTPTINTDSVTLTCNDIPDIGVTAFQWYYVNIFGGYSSYLSGSSITVTSGTYYCKATKGSSSSNSSDYTISSSVTGFSIADNGGGTPKTIPKQDAKIFSIASYVDNCSNMYAFLNENKSRENVMRSTDVYKDTLLRYLNLSKPTIVFTNTSDATKYPAPYSWSGSGTPTGLAMNADKTYTLKYNFTINNATDTTAKETQYYCNLYIDTDSDSRFISQERIGSIEIRKAPASGETQGALVDSGTLKAGQEYIVTRTLPSDMDGFLPWKLEIINVKDESVHISCTGYTYAKPTTPEVINVLQINTGRGGIGLPLDTSLAYNLPNFSNNQGVLNTAKTIRGLITSVSSDYTINIQTITTTKANNINNSSYDNITNRFDGKTYSDISSFLNSYNMVIIGFDDCFGDLSPETSTAIVNYLNSGHPILYSHDTTSMSNVPQAYDSSRTLSNFKGTGTYWGYYFNSVLRDPLGLDRYGVTSSVFGLTSKSNPSVTQSGLVAAGYSGLGTAVTKQATPITPLGTTITKDVLLDEGYSIAYTPGSNTSGTAGTPIVTTQGLSNNMYNGNSNSTAATQVNKGMITTYPFDVNLTAGSSMNILPTHQQYYQANMNPDDVTVWYCLSDGGANYAYNDASNAYYIFSNGNATYSGFGHNLQTVGQPEAKLFVNSLIAAYRITNFLPEVKFTDANGKNPLNAFLVPADSSGTLNPTSNSLTATDTSRNLYFTVNDSNVGKNKTVKAVVSYIAPDPNYPTDPTKGAQVIIDVHIYDSQTNKIVDLSKDNLVSGLAYYVKIDDIISKLTAAGVAIGNNGRVAQVTATTTVRGIPLSKTQSITLRKLELFNLG